MCKNLPGQINWFEELDIPATPSGKTSQEPCPPEKKKEKPSRRSSPSSSGSSSRALPLCLCLTKASGQQPDASTIQWEDGLWLGEYTICNSGAAHSAEKDYVFSVTSTELQRRGCYLTLNMGEKPRIPRPSKLSQILEPNPDPRYNLSEKACAGILNRASRRGKELPKELKTALEEQATPSRPGGGIEVDSHGRKAGKGPLVQTELSGTLGVSQDQTLIQPCLNSWDVQSKHIQSPDGIAEALYSGECRYGGGESYVMAEGLDAYNQEATGETSMTLTAKRSDPNHVPCVMPMKHHEPIVYDGSNVTCPTNASNPHRGDPCHTLTDDTRNYLVYENHSQDSRYKDLGDISETVSAKYGTGGNNQPLVLESNQNHATVTDSGVVNTLPSAMGMGGGYVPMVVDEPESHAVAYGISAYDSNAMKSSNPHSGIYEADSSRTLDLNGGSPACNQGGVAIVEPVPIEGNGQRESHRGDGYGESGDPMFTLNSTEHHAVAESYQDTVGALMASGYDKLGTQEAANDRYVVGRNWDGSQTSPTLTSNNAGGNQRMPDKDNFNAILQEGVECMQNGWYQATGDQAPSLLARDYKDPPVVKKPKSVVRRLTPVECERLQGFPDGWTDLGEWTDTKGKKHKEADSPRYKALGNSIGLPFWQWLAERIAAQYDRPVTLGSLFDGISGFPVCFKLAGGVPVWSSEIEEFCVAVAKKHFGDDDTGEVGYFDEAIQRRHKT